MSVASNLEAAVSAIRTLPGIGERSAMRIAMYLLKEDLRLVKQLAESLIELKTNVCFCEICSGLSIQKICSICNDKQRQSDLICVVEEPFDVLAIEETAAFNGKYHVLMGVLSPLDGIGPGDIRLNSLFSRVQKGSVKEIFIATNPTLEGDATADYIHEKLSDQDVLITRIAHGLATGGNIEFSDRGSLARSIRSRTQIS